MCFVSQTYLLNMWEEVGSVDMEKEDVLVLAWLHSGSQVSYIYHSLFFIISSITIIIIIIIIVIIISSSIIIIIIIIVNEFQLK